MTVPLSEAPDHAGAVPSGARASGAIAAPGSKSHAIRLLIAAALASGVSTVARLPGGEDVRAVIQALRALGIGIHVVGDVATVTGCAGMLPSLGDEEVRLDLGGSGTGLRLLAAVCCLGRGPYLLDGDASLRARPAAGAEEVVRALGCEAVSRGGHPPLRVSGGPLHRLPARLVAPDVSRSSQPLSALLLVAAALPSTRTWLNLGATPVSLGYVDLTFAALRPFMPADGRGGRSNATNLVLPRDGLHAADVAVEGDWSSAAYLLAAAAASGGDVRVTGLNHHSAQPDARITRILSEMGAQVSTGSDNVRCRGTGALTGARISLRDAPDLAPLVGALGCLASGETEVFDTPHLRIKESDRVASTVAAARAVGCHAEERPEGFVIYGGHAPANVVDPCGDHRIAMAFAIAGLAIPGVRILDPDCVTKSYPGFWGDLERLTGG